jgi:hypothetical protein
LLPALTSGCHPKLPSHLTYSFHRDSKPIPNIGKRERVVGQQLPDFPVVAVVDGKPMTTMAVCHCKTAFTGHPFLHLFHYSLFSFFASFILIPTTS